MSVTGNIARDVMLRKAVEAHAPDLAAIQAALPSNFDTDQAEVDLMLAHIGKPPLPPGAVAQQSSEGDMENGHPAETDAEPSPAMSVEEANADLNDWQHKTQLARNALRDCETAVKTARGKLVEAISFFLTGNKTIGRDELIRQHLASEAAERAARGGGRRGRAPSHGPSVVDIGRAGHGGNVNRRYQPTRRPDMMTGRRTYSLDGAIARSGTGMIDTHGKAPMPTKAE